MKTKQVLLLALLALATLNSAFSTAHAQGTAFTYQGQLSTGGSPASGNYDFTFALFNTNSTNTGQQIGETLTNFDVGVTNGLFIVTLNFGDVFTGTNYWLSISLRTNGGATFTALSPVQELTPTPYAIYTPNAGNAATATSATSAATAGTANNVANGIDITNAIITNSVFEGNGGGLTNLNAAQLTGSATINNLTLNGALTLPDTGTSLDIIYSGSSLLLYADENENSFIGTGAGNVATTDDGGYDNTAVGANALPDNTTGYQNTAIGEDAMYNNTSGYNNTAVGLAALIDNTSGSGNTGIGYLALLNNTSGYNNTALGLSALNYNGSGNNNTAIGPDALYKLGGLAGPQPGLPPFGGGTNNIALGYQAGYNYTENESSNIDIGNLGVTGENNTIRIGSSQTTAYIAGVITGNGGGLTNLNAAQLTGSATINNLTLNNALTLPDTGTSLDIIYSGSSLLLYADENENSFIGTGAGNVATTDDGGYDNTAVGANALPDNTTGYQNTAIGEDAMYNNTSGYNNTAVGLAALIDNTSGSGNTGIGYLALLNNTSGYNNTALGLSALNYNGSGNNNTAIGPDALYKLGGLAGPQPGLPPFGGGTNNIALGYQAGYNYTENESSNIDIGNLGVTGENNIIRIGSSQTTAYIAGTITGNGGGLTNVSAAQLKGSATLTNLTLVGTLTLPATSASSASINSGGDQLVYADNNYNFYSGFAAGSQDSTGPGNTATGDLALRYNYSGSYDTAIGEAALADNNTGSSNVAVGQNALGQLGNDNGYGGSDNIALGYQAGYNYLNNESSNIVIGNLGSPGENNIIRIGSNQTTAYIAGTITGNGGGLTNVSAAQLKGSATLTNLTLVGTLTLPATSASSASINSGGNQLVYADNNYNFYSGFAAGSQDSTGPGNTATGDLALRYNYSGSYDTAIGEAALADNNTGSSNVAVGQNALGQLGNDNGYGGSDNIALGYQAGYNYLNNESSNIVIGNLGSPGENNIIRIGSNQTTAYIAGVITGDGGGLTNLSLNNTSDSAVASGQNNTVSGSTDSVIAGGQNNTLTNVNGSTIAGGVNNTNNGNQSTIGGGAGNVIQIGAYYALLGSGGGNVIETNSDTAFLGAGYHNLIGTNAPATVLGGGQYNVISNNATFSVLGGGYQNTNTGPYSVIPGGINNVATTNSFAAGSNALATNTSAFVWSDGSASTTSTNTNSVTFRAAGGYRLFTSSGASGAFLGANQTSWATISDRDAKKNFQPVDPKAVLDKLASIPIQQWNYKWEKDGDVPNIGPMAQDFKGAFYPGRDDKSITTLEFDGVELAAIQGLNQKLNEKDAEIEKLKAKADKVDALEKQLNELKKMVQLLAERK